MKVVDISIIRLGQAWRKPIQTKADIGKPPRAMPLTKNGKTTLWVIMSPEKTLNFVKNYGE